MSEKFIWVTVHENKIQKHGEPEPLTEKYLLSFNAITFLKPNGKDKFFVHLSKGAWPTKDDIGFEVAYITAEFRAEVLSN